MKKKQLLLMALLLFSVTMMGSEKILSFKLSTANGLPDNNIRTILQDKTGYIYLRSLYAVYQYDGYDFRTVGDSTFNRLEKAVGPKDGLDNLGNKYRVDYKTGKLVYHDRKTGKTLSFQVYDPRLRSLTHNIKVNVVTDHEGRIWVSNSGFGLLMYDKRTGILRHIQKDDADHLIDSNYIVALFLDHEDNVWVSQEHYGIACLSVIQEGRFVPIGGGSNIERRHIVRMIRNIGNELLIANNDGTLYKSSGNLGDISIVKNKGDNFLAAMKDSKGRLWLGSRLRGINVGGQWLANGRIDCIIEDSKKRIWACGLHNDVMMIVFGKGGKPVIRHFFSRHYNPRNLLQDHRGNIWLASDKGVYVFNPDKLLRDAKAYRLVTDVKAKNVFEDSHNIIWIGTAGRGVLYADNGKTMPVRFKFLTRAQGLPNDVIQFVAESPRYGIIIGTENGYAWYNHGNVLARVIPGNTVRNFCNENSVVCLKDGSVAIGTLDGIILADGKRQSKPMADKDIAITDIFINGSSIMPLKTEDNGSIQLNHDENSITLYFSTFDYSRTQAIAYSYKLEGYDKGWSVPSGINFANYKNLPPGHYTFLLRCRTSDGNWYMAKRQLNIRIHSPWWATWWAITLYAILAIAFVIIVLRQLKRVNQLRQNIAIEKQLTDYKLRFFTNISHEFRTPLTLIQGAMERITRVRDIPGDMKLPISNMQRSVERMLRLINQLLEFRKMQNGKLSLALQETDVVTFLYNIYMNFYDIAENRNINYLFMPQQKSLEAYVDRGHLDKIVYNLLSNAFKYTPKNGEIVLKVGIKDGEILISVSDNGIGISKEKQAEIFERYATGKVNADSIGIGLNLTKELVRVHHGSIGYEDSPGGGSTFKVTLPLDKNVYGKDDFMEVKAELNDDDDETKDGFTAAYSEATAEPMNDKLILVVEDNPDISSMLRQELGNYFHIDTAMNGDEAWQLLSDTVEENPKGKTAEDNPKGRKLPDLIISDVMMPGMDGFELVRKIRHDDRLKHLPIILLTALTSDDKQEKGLDAGADAYIPKPFSMKVLLAQCSSLIHQREVLQHAYARLPQQKEKAPIVIRDEKDKKFVEQLDILIDSHLDDAGLSVDDLAEKFGMGRTTFYRRVRSLTGKTPNAYLNEKRMYKAADMLRTEDNITIAEVAYKVGISSPQYFATNFKKMFGKNPSEYQKGE